MSNLKKTTLYIKGMHCPSCNVLVTDKFSEISNVREVRCDYRKQEAEVYYTGSLDKEELDKKIIPFGYQIKDRDEEDKQEPLLKRITDASAIAVILFIVFYLAQEANLLPSFSLSTNLSLLSVFILGLVASTSTCMATSGALFLATVGKLKSGTSNLYHAVVFNLGRVLSYGFFGFLVGLVGKTLVVNFNLGSILSIAVAILMVLFGLNMLKIIDFASLVPSSISENIFRKLENRLIKNPKKTAFLLGAITYLLPCGFTQTVQAYALGQADPVKSAIVMMIFALGTTPALLAIGFASSFTKSSYYLWFQKIAGVLVLLIGLYYFNNYLGLYGVGIQVNGGGVDDTKQAVDVVDGYQIARMTVNNQGYSPNSFVVKKDVPVKWIVNGESIFGCQGFLVSPKLGIQKTLALGDNIFTFTPAELGTINFSCTMGMYRGRFEVI